MGRVRYGARMSEERLYSACSIGSPLLANGVNHVTILTHVSLLVHLEGNWNECSCQGGHTAVRSFVSRITYVFLEVLTLPTEFAVVGQEHRRRANKTGAEFGLNSVCVVT